MLKGWPMFWHCFAYVPLMAVAVTAGFTDNPKVIVPGLYVAAGCWFVGILKVRLSGKS